MVVSTLSLDSFPTISRLDTKWLSRVVFIPLIAGLSYEIIRFADQKRANQCVQVLIRPGLWLQRLTAREPSEDQIEVALRP